MSAVDKLRHRDASNMLPTVERARLPPTGGGDLLRVFREKVVPPR